MIDIGTGEVKGRHDGLMYYTLGQRQGLGIGGSGTVSLGSLQTRTWRKTSCMLFREMHHASLYSPVLTATGVNWIAGQSTCLMYHTVAPPNSAIVSRIKV